MVTASSSRLTFTMSIAMFAAAGFHCAADVAQSAGESPKPRVVFVDHHVHLLSPQLVADWKSLGVPFSRPDSMYTKATSYLATTDGIEPNPQAAPRAVFVPMAHLYGQESFRTALDINEADEAERVRFENNHVAREASHYPGRAVAFCGVDFLRPYALAEIYRCLGDLHTSGIKLHLASAGADLRDVRQLRQLARIAAIADSARLPLMVHLDPQQRGLVAGDIQRFIDIVIAPYSRLTMIIPHLGGSGGYAAWSQDVLGVFVAWLDDEADSGRDRAGIYFDLSAVWLSEESEGVPPSSAADAEALRRDIRRLGPDRIVFGSDYPVFQPNEYAGALLDAAALDSVTWADIMQNQVVGLWPIADEAR